VRSRFISDILTGSNRPTWFCVGHLGNLGYHKTLDAGKGVYIGSSDIDALRAMCREFGRRLNSFLISAPATSLKHADELLAAIGE